MNFTKKIDRAFQWAGEKMGNEARTGLSEEFKTLETEMALRHDGMERLHKSMNIYLKSLSKKGDTFDDKEKGLPGSYVGRTMISHGEDFDHESEFGNCLIAMGRAQERLAVLQETYVAQATSSWLESLERSLAMMKEYQAARKKLENRRLALDASTTKMQKAKREDFRLEDELRMAKAKYEESSEDVFRRMQDIKETESESTADLTSLLDAQLEYHDRAAEELRRIRREWPGAQGTGPSRGRGGQADHGIGRRVSTRSRSDTRQSHSERGDRTERWATKQDTRDEPEQARIPIRSNRPPASASSAVDDVPRPYVGRSSTYGGTSVGPTAKRSSYREAPAPPATETYRKPSVMPANVGSLRNNLRPVNRVHSGQSKRDSDVFGDDCDVTTSSGSPEYDRSESPATSYGSLSRVPSSVGLGGGRKAPPPPPSRAKKPAPPVPAKREAMY